LDEHTFDEQARYSFLNPFWASCCQYRKMHATEDRIEEKFSECRLRLREKYLRNLERKREAVLSMEPEDIAGELARSRQTSLELKEVFDLKAKREQGLRS